MARKRYIEWEDLTDMFPMLLGVDKNKMRYLGRAKYDGIPSKMWHGSYKNGDFKVIIVNLEDNIFHELDLTFKP